jgi:hypothetical protein
MTNRSGMPPAVIGLGLRLTATVFSTLLELSGRLRG